MKNVVDIIFLLFLSFNVSAILPVKIAVEGVFKPFYVGNGGIERDIISAAFLEENIEVEFHTFPLNRVGIAIDKHDMDGAATQVTAGATKDCIFSDEYVYYANTVVCRKDAGKKIEKIEDLKGFYFGAWQGAHKHMGKKFESMFHPRDKNYDEMKSLEQLNKMFWVKRLDCIMIDKFIFKDYKYTQLKKEGLKEFPIEYNFPFHRRTYFRMKFKNTFLRDSFNKGLKKIKKKGIIKKIYKKYLKNYSEEDLNWKIK